MSVKQPLWTLPDVSPLFRSLEVLLNQKRPQYIKAKERTFHQIKKVDASKKALRDHMKELAKQEENKKELQAELGDIDKAWRAFERKVAEETVHGERDVLLEENQVHLKTGMLK